MKEKTRTRFVKIKTQETTIMKPGTAEIGINTDPPAVPMVTDPDLTNHIANIVPSASINKKAQAKAKVKEAKMKKELKKGRT